MRLLTADVKQLRLKRPVMPGLVMLLQSYVSLSNNPVRTAIRAFPEGKSIARNVLTMQDKSKHVARMAHNKCLHGASETEPLLL